MQKTDVKNKIKTRPRGFAAPPAGFLERKERRCLHSELANPRDAFRIYQSNPHPKPKTGGSARRQRQECHRDGHSEGGEEAVSKPVGGCGSSRFLAS